MRTWSEIQKKGYTREHTIVFGILFGFLFDQQKKKGTMVQG
jgi:hypothetical protein